MFLITWSQAHLNKETDHSHHTFWVRKAEEWIEERKEEYIHLVTTWHPDVQLSIMQVFCVRVCKFYNVKLWIDVKKEAESAALVYHTDWFVVFFFGIFSVQLPVAVHQVYIKSLPVLQFNCLKMAGWILAFELKR